MHSSAEGDQDQPARLGEADPRDAVEEAEVLAPVPLVCVPHLKVYGHDRGRFPPNDTDFLAADDDDDDEFPAGRATAHALQLRWRCPDRILWLRASRARAMVRGRRTLHLRGLPGLSWLATR